MIALSLWTPLTPSRCALSPFATTSPRRSFRSMTLERGSRISVTIELSPDPVYPSRSSLARMSVTIELSPDVPSSFSHDSRPHDRTLEAPHQARGGTYPRATFRHARGSAAKLEGALTLERRSGTLEAPQPSSRGALTLERRSVTLEASQPSSRGALTLEWRFRPFEARQARARGSSSKRRSAWSKCLVQARKLCPTPQTPTFNFTRFEVHAPGARCAGRSSAATWPASGAGGAELAKPRRTLALPSLRRRRLASRRGAPSYGRAPPWPHARSRRAERTAGGRVRSHRRAINGDRDSHPRARTLLRPHSLHRALPPLLSLAHLAISTSPRSLGLLFPRAARTEPSFSEKFTLHTPPFPSSSRTKLALYSSSISPHFPQAIVPSPARIRDFPQIAIFGHRSTRTSSPYSEPSPRSTEHAIGFLELHWCSRTPRTSANDPELTGVEAAAAAPPPPRRRRNSDHPRPPNRPQTTRGEPRKLFPHFPEPSSPPFGRRNSGESRGPSFIVFICLGVSVQKSRDSYASHVEGAIPDGNYHLIPADEEEVPEEGAGAGSTNPEANPQFEQEGKPRSIT
nr:unnamed protein product [Digitaria exilis]